MSYVKFKGEFAKLKGMGYTFQKLFAANYMVWRKGELSIWKNGSELVIGDFDSYELIKFFRTLPILEVYSKSSLLGFYKVYNKDHTTFKYCGYNKKDRARIKKLPIDRWVHETIEMQTVDDLRKLNDLKWYEPIIPYVHDEL